MRADVSPSKGGPPTRVKLGGVGGDLKSSSSFESLRLELICFSSFSLLTADADVLTKVAAPLMGDDCKVGSSDPPVLSPYKQEVMQYDITASGSHDPSTHRHVRTSSLPGISFLFFFGGG